MRLIATFPTARPAPLSATLAKHFGHKVTVEGSDAGVTIQFDCGTAIVKTKDNALSLESHGETIEDAQKVSEIVERHLLRFAFRENPVQIEWQRAD